VTGVGGRAVALGLAVLGVGSLVLAVGLPQGTEHGGPGTRFLPLLLGGIVVALGVAVALRPGGPGGEPAAERMAPDGRRRALWTLGAIVAYVLALERLGFLLATAPFLAILLGAYGERRWTVALAVAVAATGATYALFAAWLGVPLPAGLLGR
jgi:putative tricarboxylic transport membrane protein